MEAMTVERSEQVQTPSTRVIERVAALEGVDPTELEVPLYGAIDPDLLDSLVETAADRPYRSPVRIEFSYYCYDVVVTSDGSISVTEPT